MQNIYIKRFGLACVGGGGRRREGRRGRKIRVKHAFECLFTRDMVE